LPARQRKQKKVQAKKKQGRKFVKVVEFVKKEGESGAE
jgi:hypothetical protein